MSIGYDVVKDNPEIEDEKEIRDLLELNCINIHPFFWCKRASTDNYSKKY
jgi:hypothetical protein